MSKGANSAISQSQLLAISCRLLKEREKSRVQCAIGFCLSLIEKLARDFLSQSKGVAIAIA